MREFITRKRIVLALMVVLPLAVGGFVVWAGIPLAPTAGALAALADDDSVAVDERNGWMVFAPANQTPKAGFVFYPGGRVDARAYAPQIRAVAAEGYLAVIVPMPLNLAVFGVNAGNDVIKAFPEIRKWAIGGHSLGGAMAARFVQDNPVSARGLVFWASYPDIDLSQSNIKAVSIYGTNDGLASRGGIEGSKKYLPPDAAFVPIEGGNHSQFGWYGLQPGDREASIGPEEQQAETVKATVELLARLDGAG